MVSYSSYSVGPRDTLPGSADNKRVDVHAHHREVAPAVPIDSASCCGGGRVCFHDIPADVPHRDAAKCGTPDKTLATTNTLNDDECECTHAKGLCNAVEAGREELEGGSRDTEGFEDAGCVVGDDVDLYLISDDEVWMEMLTTYACKALQEHESKTDGHAVSHTLLEELLELSLLAHAVRTALLNLCTDLAHLVLDVRVR